MKIKTLIITLIMFLNCLPILAVQNLQYAKVTRVMDGDTVQLKLKSNSPSIRLIGIDCYETSAINRAYKQAYANHIPLDEVISKGLKAKHLMTQIMKQNNYTVYFECTGTDYYGRLLGVLYTKDGKNINTMMQNSGFCPKYVFVER